MRLHGKVLLLLALLACLVVPGAAAQPAHLVTDLNPGLDGFEPGNSPATFSSYLPVNGRVVFFGFLEEGEFSGLQCGLWVTDGTEGGTERLADLCSQVGNLNNSKLRMLVSTGSVAFFSDVAGILWRTDGTAAGTYSLGVEVGGEYYLFPVILPGTRTIIFSGCTANNGCELWRSDGTREGTRLIRDLRPGAGSFPVPLSTYQGRVLFTATGGLWATDGTAQGTVLLVQTGGFVARPIPLGGKLFFMSFGNTDDVWVLDVATRKATKLKTFPSDRHLGANLYEAGGRILIRQYDDESGRYSLWETDGTRAGTRKLADFSALGANVFTLGTRALFMASQGTPRMELWALDPNSLRPSPLRGCPGGCPRFETDPEDVEVFAGRAYFAGWDAVHGTELWTSDGTAQGTRIVKDLCPGACDGRPTVFRPMLGRLLFLDATAALWVTDGSEAGTVRLAQSVPGNPILPLDVARLRRSVVFTGFDPARGYQPWISDLTPQGTHPIATIAGGLAGSSRINHLVMLGETTVFHACDGQTEGVYRSDGTEAGTFRLVSATTPCELFGFLEITRVGSFAYFFLEHRLWRTDGTEAGTVELVELPDAPFLRDPSDLGGRLLFVVDPPQPVPFPDGWVWTFWTSDGTPQGTREAFSRRFGGTPNALTVVGGEAFFYAQQTDSPFPNSLWRTDGTEAGTRVLLPSTGGGGLKIESARLGAWTYLLVATGDGGLRLWRTDGTAAGTTPVLPETAVQPRNPRSLVVFRDTLYFWADDGLWRSDGTADGTRRVKALPLPGDAQNPGFTILPELTPAGGFLFFRAEDPAHGAELWRSDGTAAGTVLVADIFPGPASSRPGWLTAAGGRLYFAATDGVHGYELWTSDGTAAGTQLVQDIQPGPAPSNPRQLTAADGALFFTANDGEHGRELWVLPLPR